MADETDLEDFDDQPASTAFLVFTINLRKVLRFLETVEIYAEYGELNGKKFKKFVRDSDTPIRPEPGLDAGCVFDDAQREYLLRLTLAEIVSAFRFFLMTMLVQIGQKRPGATPILKAEESAEPPDFDTLKSWDDVVLAAINLQANGLHYTGFDGFARLFDEAECPVSEDPDVMGELDGIFKLREEVVQMPVGISMEVAGDEDDPYVIDEQEVADVHALLLEVALDLDTRATRQFGLDTLADAMGDVPTE